MLVLLIGTGIYFTIRLGFLQFTQLFRAFGIPEVITVIVVTLLVSLIIVGGIESISKISEVIVPIMAILYTSAALFILATHIGELQGDCCS